jgi:outer membrane protein
MKRIYLILSITLSCSIAYTQSLRELLSKAEQNYPLIKAKQYESNARQEDLRFAKSAVIPTLDAGYQVNYATYNNITGMATSQNFVPISGPPSSANSSQAVLGTAGGLLLNWDVFTFGQRTSRIKSAKASLEAQQAEEQNEIFQHRIKVANAYLDLMMTYELVKVYQKNLERADDNLRIVRSLSASGLRPGVDTALFQSELSKARIDLINYEGQRETLSAHFSELLGDASFASVAQDSSFFDRLPGLADTTSAILHPSLKLSSSRIRIIENEKSILLRSMLPKLSLWGTAYARGSGIRYDGYINSEDGLSFSRYNYGAGVVLSVPLLQFTRTQYQVRSQTFLAKAQEEVFNATKLELAKQERLADVTFANAIKIANESPSFQNSADYAYRGLLSRYNSGLVSYTEVIQAQYALVKAESDLARAHIEAWKALLFKSAVAGDINLFLNQL